MRARSALVGRLVAEGVRCEVGPVLALAGLPTNCGGAIGGLHERRKRSSSGSVEHAPNLIPACNACNGAVEDLGDSTLRAKTGTALVVRQRDPEWAELGRDVEPVPVEVKVCRACGGSWVSAVRLPERVRVTPCCYSPIA